MTKAHDKQLAEYARANAAFASENAALKAEHALLMDNMGKMQNNLSFANTAANEYRASIELFKAEAAASAATIAEMRGYIVRTLEDDKVREQFKAEHVPMDTTTTVRVDPKYVEPVRRGPDYLKSHLGSYPSAPYSVSNEESHRTPGIQISGPPKPPKPWHSR